jgi:transcriptional regulator with XRE-family HTH domain
VTTSHNNLPARVARLIARAVKESGKSYSEIARAAGMKRDSLRRSLSGGRPVTLDEVVLILEASDLASEETLLLLLLVGEDFALARSGTGPALFLGKLFKHAPLEIIEQLGEDIDELRPRWAHGTAKLLARTLTQHIADLNRRGDAIGGPRYSAAVGE